MNLHELAEINYDVYTNADREILKWILKNEKNIITAFKKKFPRSPYDYRIQVKVGNCTKLLLNDGTSKSMGNMAYLTTLQLRRMGCPKSTN